MFLQEARKVSQCWQFLCCVRKMNFLPFISKLAFYSFSPHSATRFHAGHLVLRTMQSLLRLSVQAAQIEVKQTTHHPLLHTEQRMMGRDVSAATLLEKTWLPVRSGLLDAPFLLTCCILLFCTCVNTVKDQRDWWDCIYEVMCSVFRAWLSVNCYNDFSWDVRMVKSVSLAGLWSCGKKQMYNMDDVSCPLCAIGAFWK